MRWKSEPQIPALVTRTRTPVSGGATETTSIPRAVWRTARIS
jgi:hypothetical protein